VGGLTRAAEVEGKGGLGRGGDRALLGRALARVGAGRVELVAELGAGRTRVARGEERRERVGGERLALEEERLQGGDRGAREAAGLAGRERDRSAGVLLVPVRVLAAVPGARGRERVEGLEALLRLARRKLAPGRDALFAQAVNAELDPAAGARCGGDSWGGRR
jgi:hypothetical protein